MPPICADDELRAHFHFAVRSLCTNADHAVVLDEQIDDFVFHQQLEIRKSFCVRG